MTRRLREVEVVDLSRLARLHAQCFPEDRWDARALAELLAMAGASGHLIEESSKDPPLGLILDLLAGDTAEILTLGVAPMARRQGVARMLLQDLATRAAAAGAAQITLEVAADNLPARQLYESSGFKAAGRRAGYYRRGSTTIDALLFRRTLLG